MKENSFLEKAKKYWDEGKPIDAGRLIFEALPNSSRPLWAAQILKIVSEKSNIQNDMINRLIKMASNQSEWINAKKIFSVIRQTALDLDKKRESGLSKDQEILGWVLSLAELVAKVTYNAINPFDEFDEDSGWWIASNLNGFCKCLADEDFTKKAWTILCGQNNG